MESEGDVLVVLVLTVFVSPRITLQELLNCLPYGYIGIERTFDRLTSERISPSIFLEMLLQSLTLISLTAVCGHRIFHQIERYPAYEVIRNSED